MKKLIFVAILSVSFLTGLAQTKISDFSLYQNKGDSNYVPVIVPNGLGGYSNKRMYGRDLFKGRGDSIVSAFGNYMRYADSVSLSNRITANGTAISSKQTDLKIVNLKTDYGAVSDGITDNTTALISALNSSATDIYIPGDSNSVYLFTGQVNNISKHIFGSGAKFVSTYSGGAQFTTNATAFYTNTAAAVFVTKGISTITVPDASTFSVGDIVMIWDNVTIADVNPYRHGIFTEIQGISGNILTVTDIPEENFTADNIRAYHPNKNIKIEGLTFQSAQPVITLNLVRSENAIVQNCRFIGKNSQPTAAIIFNGFNGIARDNFIDGFPNFSVDGTGYGIALSGHNMIAQHNFIKNCKHGTTAGDYNYMSTGIRSMYNELWATGTAIPLDFHGNNRGEATGNWCYTNNTAGVGINVRSGGVHYLYNWLFYDVPASVTTVKAFDIFDRYDGNNSFIGNHIYLTNVTGKTAVFAFQFEQAGANNAANVIIKDNYSNNGGINFNSKVGNVITKDNYLDATEATFGYISFADSISSATTVDNNTFVNNSTGFSYAVTTAKDMPVSLNITNNIIRVKGTTTSFAMFRLTNTRSNIVNNQFFTNNNGLFLLDQSASKENYIKDNKQVNTSGVMTEYSYATLPAATSFFEGKWASVVSGSTTQMWKCEKTGTGVYTWVYPADLTNPQTFTGVKTFSSTVTATSGAAKGAIHTPSLTAAANGDVLSGLYIVPTYTNGAFTSVVNNFLTGQGNISAQRIGSASQSIGIQPFPANNTITSYAPSNNSKELIINSTTDSSGTTPTSGTVAINFQVLGSTKMKVQQTGNVTFGATTDNGSGVQFYKSESHAINNYTGAHTLGVSDFTSRDSAGTAAYTVTLPSAVGIAGRIYIIKKIDATANAITVGTTSSQNISGSTVGTTYPLATQGKYVKVQSNGNNWDVIGNNGYGAWGVVILISIALAGFRPRRKAA